MAVSAFMNMSIGVACMAGRRVPNIMLQISSGNYRFKICVLLCGYFKFNVILGVQFIDEDRNPPLH